MGGRASEARGQVSATPTKNATDQMKIERHFIAEMSIYKFGALNGLTMEVHERDVEKDSPARFYAHFKHAEVKDGSILCGTFGDGKTEREAILDYAKAISLKLLVVDAGTDERREIRVPRLA